MASGFWGRPSTPSDWVDPRRASGDKDANHQLLPGDPSGLGDVFAGQLQEQQHWLQQQEQQHRMLLRGHNTTGHTQSVQQLVLMQQRDALVGGWGQRSNLRPGTAPVPRIQHGRSAVTQSGSLAAGTESVAEAAARTFFPPPGALPQSTNRARSRDQSHQLGRALQSRGESRGQSRGQSRGRSRGSLSTGGPETVLPPGGDASRSGSRSGSRGASRSRSRGGSRRGQRKSTGHMIVRGQKRKNANGAKVAAAK